ncbi:MAG: hypothetical protein LBD04_04570 [Synergistaceae bacterium]|jgi:hypothetical protein|nr:hypothetical protein [Synergistaceae bacterium]
MAGFLRALIARSGKTPLRKSVDLPATKSGLSGLWWTLLPLLLGGVFGWLGMATLGTWLDGHNRRVRPAFFSFAATAAVRDDGFSNMTSFLKSNPFKISPMKIPERQEEDIETSVVTGSLAAATLRWTMPDAGVMLEDQGKHHVVLTGGSFDLYTLEEVDYHQAVFRKDGERVIKELSYRKTGPALSSPAPVPPGMAMPARQGSQLVAVDPSKGGTGVINREVVNQLLENPFDELKKVRIRPARNGQGLMVQRIDADSVLAQLGVQRGDVIHSINGIVFHNMTDVTNSVNSLMNSDNFEVDVTRGGSPFSLRYAVR